MPWIGASALDPVRRALRAGALVVAAPAALAQGAATPAASAASVNESAVSERVRREASNPLRIILEASKIRRGPAEPEVVPVRRVVPAASVTPAAVAPTPATPAPVTSAATPTVPAPATAPPPPPEPATRVLDTLREPAPAARGERIATDGVLTPVPAATPLALPAVPAGGPIAAPPPAQPAPAPVSAGAMPRLLTRVDPDIPSAVMRRLGYPSELLVQVTIERDGRLRDIRLPAAAQRAAEPYVIEALSQWRYESVPEPRVQRLNLVFSN